MRPAALIIVAYFGLSLSIPDCVNVTRDDVSLNVTQLRETCDYFYDEDKAGVLNTGVLALWMDWNVGEESSDRGMMLLDCVSNISSAGHLFVVSGFAYDFIPVDGEIVTGVSRKKRYRNTFKNPFIKPEIYRNRSLGVDRSGLLPLDRQS